MSDVKNHFEKLGNQFITNKNDYLKLIPSCKQFNEDDVRIIYKALYKAIELHGGDTSNNCVFFTSEALRRVGIDLPLGTCNTYDLEDKLQAMGFVESYDLSQLKPGDIVFTNGYTHVYIFMGWSANGYAYICDNQADRFDNKVLHLRNIYGDTDLTDRATHFFYYPY